MSHLVYLGNGKVMQIGNPTAHNPDDITLKVVPFTPESHIKSSKNDDDAERDYKDYMLSVFNKSSRR